MKRGETGKLIYDFEPASNCEICLNDVWYRSTPREFRSFSGKRRINNQPYEGPVYFFKTNLEVNVKNHVEEIMYSPNIEYIVSKKRIGETFEI